MRYKTKHLKPGLSFIIDNDFPKTLEVGKSYKLSFDFHPTSEDEGWTDSISIREI